MHVTLSDVTLRRRFTGMVVDGYAVEPDVDGGSVECATCASEAVVGVNDGGTSDATLVAGDRVVVAFSCYDNHSWEPLAVYCPDHGARTVAEAMGVDAVDQAVVAAVLESAGYHSPDGAYYPNALTLGEVDLLDASPAADGY